MGQISKFLRSQANGGLLYWCQGCNLSHAVNVGEGPGPRWVYNGNPYKPTFTPSVRVEYHLGEPPIYPGYQLCHTFITDGKVQFLSDCTHALAGQTLDLPELPAHLQDAPA